MPERLTAAHLDGAAGTSFATPVTVVRTCPLCEATCGLELQIEDRTVTRIRGDRADVFSRGYLCTKGALLHHVEHDPDRLRAPLVRTPDGGHTEVSWDDAFAEAERRLRPVIDDGDRRAVAVYMGNPNAHNLSGLLYLTPLLRALATPNLFSASTVDQMPKQVAASYLFGSGASIAVPDVDRTELLVIIGADPFESNGSMLTAPDLPGRLRRLTKRGGELVVVDPRRSRTAEAATEHLAIRPGTDGYLLAAVARTLCVDGLVDLGRLAPWVNGLEDLAAALEAFTTEGAAAVTGIPADQIAGLARRLAIAPAAVVYGRMGTTTTEYGTTTSWLIYVLNILTGNLDRPGGAMFTLPAVGSANTRSTPRVRREFLVGRHSSRVSAHPEVFGEYPAVALAEEIDTPGNGQVRALITIAGNPVLSVPGAARLEAALGGLDAYVAVDAYLNETTRHAHVILPVPGPLSRPHFDVALYRNAIRNVANYSPPVFDPEPGMVAEEETLLRLALIAAGRSPTSAAAARLDDALALDLAAKANIDLEDLPAGRRGPERLLDLTLRGGPYGLTIDDLLASPHGIDLGPLRPRLPDLLRTPSGMIELAHPTLVGDLARLRELEHRPAGQVLLVGRRSIRSNNSWMHNIAKLVAGKGRCTLHVHPNDAARAGLIDGQSAAVTSPAGTVTVPVEVTNRIRPGVVSIPHGWGHDTPGTRLQVASATPGVNVNLLTDATVIDPLSATSALNAIPVILAPAPPTIEGAIDTGGAADAWRAGHRSQMGVAAVWEGLP